MRALMLGVVVLALAGCTAAPQKAVISDISDSALKVVAPASMPMANVDIEAQSGCGIYSKRAYPISSVCFDQYCTRKEYLFSCD